MRSSSSGTRKGLSHFLHFTRRETASSGKRLLAPQEGHSAVMGIGEAPKTLGRRQAAQEPPQRGAKPALTAPQYGARQELRFADTRAFRPRVAVFLWQFLDARKAS